MGKTSLEAVARIGISRYVQVGFAEVKRKKEAVSKRERAERVLPREVR